MNPRCRCRPGCLAPVYPDDPTSVTATGLVLAEHLTLPSGQLPLPLASPGQPPRGAGRDGHSFPTV